MRSFALSVSAFLAICTYGIATTEAYSKEKDICAYMSRYGIEDTNVYTCRVTLRRGVILNRVKGDLATFLLSNGRKIQVWSPPEDGRDAINQGGCWPNIHEREKRCQVFIKTGPSQSFVAAESFYNGMNCQKPFKRDACITILGLDGKYSGSKVLTWGYDLDSFD